MVADAEIGGAGRLRIAPTRWILRFSVEHLRPQQKTL